MADGVFNISKGKVGELAQRVVNNDPANSALIVVLSSGAITDATLRDLDTLQQCIDDAGFTEATFTNYARKVVEAPVITVVDASDRLEADMPDLTWAAAGNGVNNTLTRLSVHYDGDTTGGNDSNIVPLTFHDFTVTTDGSDITAQFHAQGFFNAN